MPTEIRRRLANAEAGLTHPIKLGDSQIRKYIRDYNEINGPPPKESDLDQSLDSVERLKQRALALVQREIAKFERTAQGQIDSKQATALARHVKTLDEITEREEKARKRLGNQPSRKEMKERAKAGKAASSEPLWVRIAREEKEAQEQGESAQT